MKRFALPIALVLLTCLLASAYSQETAIKPGDIVSVTVLGEPDLTKKFVVDQDGNITMPLVQQVHIAGLTTAQAIVEITTQLKKMIKNPQVSIDQVEPGKLQITVSGEVKNPGILALASGAKLIDAITAAGGYTPNADLSKVSLSHMGPNPVATTIDLSKFLLGGDVSVNVALAMGDTIQIPTKVTNTIGSVSVLGAVRQSGTQPITQGMTVREAIMAAGGPTEFADTMNVTVRHDGATENMPVDYAKAAQGDPNANILLRPGDTVYVAARQQLGFYTIQGGVGSPGRYEIKGPTSITEAIAIAGGIKSKVNMNDVSILRGSAGETKTMKLKVGEIMVGKSPNVPIQDGDNIIVPNAPEKHDMMGIASLAVSLAWLLLRR